MVVTDYSIGFCILNNNVSKPVARIFPVTSPCTKRNTDIVNCEISHRIREDESPLEVVVTAVAAIENRGPTKLPPIYDVLAADALNKLLADQRGGVEVSFTYCGYRVTASSAEVVVNGVE